MELCPNCGLPMSLTDDATITDNPYWYCDGPNDNTDKDGCGSTLVNSQGLSSEGSS